MASSTLPCKWKCINLPSFPFPVSLSSSRSSFLRRNQFSSISSPSTSVRCTDGNPSRDPPSPKYPLSVSTGSILSGDGESSQATNNSAAAGAGGGFVDGFSRSRWRRGFLKLFRRRSLWKRIFFASKKVRSIILLNVLALIYASNIPVVKEVEAVMDPALFNVVRFAISAIPFIPCILKARGDQQTRSAGIELGFWVSLGYLGQALGLLTADAGRASFISAFTVIVVPFMDGLFGAEVPTYTWYGAVTSLVGVAMLESSGSPPSVGDLLNILSAVFFGVHMLRTEQISRVTKKENFLALLGYEVCVIAFSSVIWYFSRDIFGVTHPGNSASTVWDFVVSFPWVPALYTGVFSTGLCLWAEISAMRDVSATETAIIYGLEPLWGAAFAWFLLGERWGTTGWIGAALVLGGSLTVQILGSTPDKSEENTDSKGQLEALDVVNNLDNFTLSTVVVNSRKNVRSLPKKPDKS